MSIRSLSLTIPIVALVLFASALPKPAVAQAPIVVSGPQFQIVATTPNPKYKEMTYCGAGDIYFTFEPATLYSPNNEYVLFHYLDENKAIAHDEASLANVTVIVDDTVSTPMARLVGTERGQNIWNIVVTAKMKEAWSGCLGKLKTQ
jgi:hypothetical protein